MVEPGWRLVDIGAATGALAIPMASIGCSVTAVEPSEGMRSLFGAQLAELGVSGVSVIGKRFEDLDLGAIPRDLVVACNSLHLTSEGMAGAMKKIFSSAPGMICLVTEVNRGVQIDFKEINALQDSHEFLSIRNYRVDSSFFFIDMAEVREFEAAMETRVSVEMDNAQPVQRDSSDIAVVWWELKRGRSASPSQR
jgi:hypothetical protein